MSALVTEMEVQFLIKYMPFSILKEEEYCQRNCVLLSQTYGTSGSHRCSKSFDQCGFPKGLKEEAAVDGYPSIP